MTDHRAQDTASSKMAGTVLGSYRVVEELSTGGMGTVYRAVHELLGRSAAVKVLRPELTANAELVQRFFNEAKAATAIRHPGIIEVFDFGYAADGRAYLVMEFLDGESLSKRVDRGRLSEQQAAQIARGIASALTAAHERGIVHRDLKPDNIFMVPDPDVPGGERPKILDFGIAKLADPVPSSVSHTVTGTLMGTPLYMAPEQARAAGEIDPRADLYSLGCILYELLVGAPPFVAEGAGEIIALQLFGQPDAPSARLDAISPEIEAIVMRLLEKEPRDRYQSAADVTRALGGMIGRLSTEISAPRGAGDPRPTITLATRSVPPSVQPKPARNTMPLIAGGITLAAIAAVTAVLLWSRSQPDPPAAQPPIEIHKAPPPPTPQTIEIEVKAPPEVKPVQLAPIDTSKPPRVPVRPPSRSTPSRSTPSAGSATTTDDKKSHTDKGSPIEVNLDSKEP